MSEFPIPANDRHYYGACDYLTTVVFRRLTTLMTLANKDASLLTTSDLRLTCITLKDCVGRDWKITRYLRTRDALPAWSPALYGRISLEPKIIETLRTRSYSYIESWIDQFRTLLLHSPKCVFEVSHVLVRAASQKLYQGSRCCFPTTPLTTYIFPP